MNKARVGYFGGTFDPPHLGHIILAAESKHFLGLERIRWIITPNPPHKKDRVISPVQNRLDMLELVVAKLGMFEICEIEIQRDPPHYAADTVEILKRENPAENLVYIIGEDSLKDLPEWHDTDRFLAAIDQLAVVPRPEISTDQVELGRRMPGLTKKIIFIPNLMLEISSSVIRDRVQGGGPYEHFLMDSVTEYIVKNKLYLT